MGFHFCDDDDDDDNCDDDRRLFSSLKHIYSDPVTFGKTMSCRLYSLSMVHYFLQLNRKCSHLVELNSMLHSSSHSSIQ